MFIGIFWLKKTVWVPETPWVCFYRFCKFKGISISSYKLHELIGTLWLEGTWYILVNSAGLLEVGEIIGTIFVYWNILFKETLLDQRDSVSSQEPCELTGTL